MAQIMKFNGSVITTIPSIGYINDGMILGEVGDIHHFSCPSKLLAFAGLDPSIYQSGNYNSARCTRMSKRGSRVLRYTLINSAYNVVPYYDKKMVESRTHYNALGTVLASSPRASGRCSLTKPNLTLTKRSVYQYQYILKMHSSGALLKLPFLSTDTKKKFFLIKLDISSLISQHYFNIKIEFF